MPLQSMTGFARKEGSSGRCRWAWELRSVNGKGLDVRMRLPPGLERLEPDCRRLATQYFSRGNLQIALSLTSSETAIEAVINHEALAAVLKLREQIGDRVDPAPLRFDTLLTIRGIIDFREPEESESEREGRDADILAGLEQALADLKGMREKEGTALGQILSAQVDRIEQLRATVENDPSRSPQAIADRLAQQLAQVMENSSSLDRERLHVEVALLATRADLREEIDRLGAHVAAARDLLAKGGPVGRKLDFLAQEFNRESNTICSKSNAAAVSAAGIELKVVIDQFREQVQNLE
ncbi:YicC/YloC family endoribonuclease [Ensifer sp. LCM 4579]|uniref:YicC/YloC family endoribonuclease n=1 Tax=Ensifer sp. LCM 4579 TaxID=1848292 RepID=UPI0008D8EE76|nr:YicC/YloC family endoribonuclease [Ensifer sp. LCM 4579]OHV72327.1 YicC family protein [Ensifer sp. LCM 4579]